MMRGEKQQEELQQLTLNRNRMASARIIDDAGNIQFHIVSTWWSRIILAIILLLLVAVVALTALVILNKTSIDTLEQKSDQLEQVVEDNQQNVKATNTNRR